MRKLNYEGIASINLENVNAVEVASGVSEYTLCQNENKKITAVYKFEENSKFPLDFHESYDEHIYVLSGIFNDGRTDYEKGSYIVNPKGTAHLPQSKDGCTVLVTYFHK